MRVYLDHNATTPAHPDAVASMMPFFGNRYGNPSSRHRWGREALEGLEGARRTVADALGAAPGEIHFTGGGTEADNIALLGAVRASGVARPHVISCAVEHPAVLECRGLLEALGAALEVLPVDGAGRADPEAVARAIRPETVLVSLQLANNEVGTVQPVERVGALCRARGILCHTDAVQALGKIPVDVGALQADLVSLSSHKVYGPKGVGALYVRDGTPIHPLSAGGFHGARVRAGTENVAGAVGFARAVAVASRDLATNGPRMLALRDLLERRIREGLDDVRLNGHPLRRLPNTLNLSFPGAAGDALMMHLDGCGVAVSTGAACSAGSQAPSGILLAMGVDPGDARCSIRFSVGIANTEEEMEYAARCTVEGVKRLRATAGR